MNRLGTKTKYCLMIREGKGKAKARKEGGRKKENKERNLVKRAIFPRIEKPMPRNCDKQGKMTPIYIAAFRLI